MRYKFICTEYSVLYCAGEQKSIVEATLTTTQSRDTRINKQELSERRVKEVWVGEFGKEDCSLTLAGVRTLC